MAENQSFIIPMTKDRIRKEDKKILASKAVDVNHLIPNKYEWAWQY